MVRARAAEAAGIVNHLHEPPYDKVVEVHPFSPVDGYRLWSQTYDGGENLVIDREQEVVRPLLAALPVGRVLDAACGTGRHARWLADRGHTVIGVDATEEMLAVARDKVPAAQFLLGNLEALPVQDASVDVAVCTLALTHLPSLDGASAELARVLLPGGRLILSDIHPFFTALGLHAFFPTPSGEPGGIRNHFHPISRYLTAFRAAGLDVVDCIEATWSDAAIQALPTYGVIPDGLAAALTGMPLILAWDLQRSSDL
jgi:SAM-dependent methyltransferase